MKPTRALSALGQSLWIDNITRDMLTSGTLERYIADLSVTGLTSNPTIFDHAIGHSSSYDDEIRRLDVRVGDTVVVKKAEFSGPAENPEPLSSTARRTCPSTPGMGRCQVVEKVM